MHTRYHPNFELASSWKFCEKHVEYRSLGIVWGSHREHDHGSHLYDVAASADGPDLAAGLEERPSTS